MKRYNLIWLLMFIMLAIHAQSPVDKKACIPCDQLKNIRLPDVTIISVELMEADTISGAEAWMGQTIIKVPFCKLYGRISREINFELLLPVQWNGRFLMSGGGGFVGNIQNDLRNYVNQGYATAGTDTGHKGVGTSAEWALNNMERQLNFGRLAIHRTAVVSKSIINSTYCEDAAFSYFLGCSRGGGQALVEAQYYPEDFDGLVAGAPLAVLGGRRPF
jgi:feruloyl esterase